MQILTGLYGQRTNGHDPAVRRTVPVNPTPSEGRAATVDATARVVEGVLGQVVDLLKSVAAGVEANRANHRPPVADQRLFEGASAVMADLVEHTRVGEERPLAGDVRPRLVYGGGAPVAASRAWLADVRQQVAGLRGFLDQVASGGLNPARVESLHEWQERVAGLVSAPPAGPLDLTA
ncbi:MAG: hypothetical protein KF857_11245 [Fimbriimonadaceae bacterium]|nr:hypothetical protein [Fimbriimonadaceae bacterium]